jgi:uncharacterized protein YjbI with pentapeptide repeats
VFIKPISSLLVVWIKRFGLQDADLSEVLFENCNFASFIFDGCCSYNTDFDDEDLSSAIICGSNGSIPENLVYTDQENMDIEGKMFPNGIDGYKAIVPYSKFQNSDLSKSNFTGADFKECDFRGAIFDPEFWEKYSPKQT